MADFQREKLIELKTKFVESFECGDCTPANDKCRKCLSEKETDYLLKNGVIVPPCKVGEELYCVYSPPYPANPADKGKWYMGEFEVARFHYGVKGLSIEMYGYGTVNVNEIGKTVFLSREEAEKTLAERSECI